MRKALSVPRDQGGTRGIPRGQGAVRGMRPLHCQLSQKDHRKDPQISARLCRLLFGLPRERSHEHVQIRLYRVRALREELSGRRDRDERQSPPYRLFEMHRLPDLRGKMPQKDHPGDLKKSMPCPGNKGRLTYMANHSGRFKIINQTLGAKADRPAWHNTSERLYGKYKIINQNPRNAFTAFPGVLICRAISLSVFKRII